MNNTYIVGTGFLIVAARFYSHLVVAPGVVPVDGVVRCDVAVDCPTAADALTIVGRWMDRCPFRDDEGNSLMWCAGVKAQQRPEDLEGTVNFDTWWDETPPMRFWGVDEKVGGA